jgi:transglutaminase-like putative cysteine protease
MLYRTTHTTRYLYEEPVSQCLSLAHLTPRSFPGQALLESAIQVEPEPALFSGRRDYFGNEVTSFSILQSHDRFTTTATSLVRVERRTAELPPLTWEEARDRLAAYADAPTLEAYGFVFDSPLVALYRELADFAAPCFPEGRPLVEAARELSARIHSGFTYLPQSTSVDMPLIEAFRKRCGVCQDFSHIMIGALRSLRLAARYVSGYLRSGANYQGAEASHAWVSVFVPGAGWLDFDPTNNIMPTDGHVTVAWGRDYGDVTPMKGIALGGGKQVVEVAVRAERVVEQNG